MPGIADGLSDVVEVLRLAAGFVPAVDARAVCRPRTSAAGVAERLGHQATPSLCRPPFRPSVAAARSFSAFRIFSAARSTACAMAS